MLLGGLAATLGVAALRVGRIDLRGLATRNPGTTSLMREREAEALAAGQPFAIDQRWVPYDGIATGLRRAVLIAEDDAFFSHDGLDWREIRESARTDLRRRRFVRGGSTITQQLARNLFLGAERTPMRKLEEMLLARRLERTLGKRRIFELYLNLIEWGDGVFGIEAAARHYYGVGAADLDARQAVLLAAVIINPRRFSPLDPGTRIQRRVRIIASRMERRGLLSEAEYLYAIGGPPPRPSFLEWLFGPAPSETGSLPLDTLADSTSDSTAAPP